MRALNLGKIGVSLCHAVSFMGISSLPPPCFVAILISRVQPPAFDTFVSFVWYPCSYDTKSLDIWRAKLGAEVCFQDLLRHGRRSSRASLPPCRLLARPSSSSPRPRRPGGSRQGCRAGRQCLLQLRLRRTRRTSLLHGPPLQAGHTCPL
jgi:hypothetical protein